MFLLDPKHSEMNSPEDIRMNTLQRAGLTGSQEELDPFIYTQHTHTHTHTYYGPVLSNISLLIIPCMIVYVTNNKEP